ncbi:acyltransferase [Dyella halodurans]|uniref:Acyltransferase n=1 Tax=Dyella halodurans TaxID=1920171 RepID=A0ABV9C5Z8_9GAMM|nr:acyltransferase [Dyella halodurans]
MLEKLRHAVFLVIEKLLRWCISPKLRAALLRMFGASVGRNVRVAECQFINLRMGFSNLRLDDDVYVGPGCLIDLEGAVLLGKGVTLSPRVQIITHDDPGAYHKSPLLATFPKKAYTTQVGTYSWIGVGSTVISGATIGDFVVVGAMTLVKADLSSKGVYVGVPARRIRSVDVP